MEKTAFDLARKQLFYCNEADLVPAAAEVMHKNNVGSIIVKDPSGKPVGIVTVGDILRRISRKADIYKTTLENIMSKPVITAEKDADINTIIKIFNEKKVTRVVLTDSKGKYVGVIRDIAAYKFLSLVKYESESTERFGRNYFNRL